jgi:glycosyltransferase involved in cell wall biosynthesis
MIEATVLVCTRNRGGELARALDVLGAHATTAPWELLVVDNASTDDTCAVARRFAARHPDRVRVAVEPTLGLSAARDCGVRLARGEIVVFLDDDAEPLPGWLDAYLEALREPGVLAAGGPVEPLFSGPLPVWLGARFLPYLSVWDRGREPHDLAYNELPRGTNMAFRREAFELVGGFDRRLGRSGRSLRSCEETELGLRLERCGGRIVYVPGAGVRHRVDASRLTPRWMAARFAAQGFSEAIVDWKHLGFAGTRRGWAAATAAVARAGREGAQGEAAGIELACARAARTAYGWGSLYAALRVERWSPPERAARA